MPPRRLEKPMESDHEPDVVYMFDGDEDLPWCGICFKPIGLNDDGKKPTPAGMADGEYWEHLT